MADSPVPEAPFTVSLLCSGNGVAIDAKNIWEIATTAASRASQSGDVLLRPFLTYKNRRADGTWDLVEFRGDQEELSHLEERARKRTVCLYAELPEVSLRFVPVSTVLSTPTSRTSPLRIPQRSQPPSEVTAVPPPKDSRTGVSLPTDARSPKDNDELTQNHPTVTDNNARPSVARSPSPPPVSPPPESPPYPTGLPPKSPPQGRPRPTTPGRPTSPNTVLSSPVSPPSVGRGGPPPPGESRSEVIVKATLKQICPGLKASKAPATVVLGDIESGEIGVRMLSPPRTGVAEGVRRRLLSPVRLPNSLPLAVGHLVKSVLAMDMRFDTADGKKGGWLLREGDAAKVINIGSDGTLVLENSEGKRSARILPSKIRQFRGEDGGICRWDGGNTDDELSKGIRKRIPGFGKRGVCSGDDLYAQRDMPMRYPDAQGLESGWVLKPGEPGRVVETSQDADGVGTVVLENPLGVRTGPIKLEDLNGLCHGDGKEVLANQGYWRPVAVGDRLVYVAGTPGEPCTLDTPEAADGDTWELPPNETAEVVEVKRRGGLVLKDPDGTLSRVVLPPEFQCWRHADGSLCSLPAFPGRPRVSTKPVRKGDWLYSANGGDVWFTSAGQMHLRQGEGAVVSRVDDKGKVFLGNRDGVQYGPLTDEELSRLRHAGGPLAQAAVRPNAPRVGDAIVARGDGPIDLGDGIMLKPGEKAVVDGVDPTTKEIFVKVPTSQKSIRVKADDFGRFKYQDGGLLCTAGSQKKPRRLKEDDTLFSYGGKEVILDMEGAPGGWVLKAGESAKVVSMKKEMIDGEEVELVILQNPQGDITWPVVTDELLRLFRHGDGTLITSKKGLDPRMIIREVVLPMDFSAWNDDAADGFKNALASTHPSARPHHFEICGAEAGSTKVKFRCPGLPPDVPVDGIMQCLAKAAEQGNQKGGTGEKEDERSARLLATMPGGKIASVRKRLDPEEEAAIMKSRPASRRGTTLNRAGATKFAPDGSVLAVNSLPADDESEDDDDGDESDEEAKGVPIPVNNPAAPKTGPKVSKSSAPVLRSDAPSGQREEEVGESHGGHLEAVEVTVVGATHLADRENVGFCDAYVLVEAHILDDHGKVFKLPSQRTPVIPATLNPDWNHSFVFTEVDAPELHLRFFVLDSEPVGDTEFLGTAEFTVTQPTSQLALPLGPRPGEEREGDLSWIKARG
eukprot:Hpha_TRINITY_DN15444_c1_g13::TRINITY_DN15444_c1_g13_i1::g.176160::m.176160